MIDWKIKNEGFGKFVDWTNRMLKLIKKYPITLVFLLALSYNVIVLGLLGFENEGLDLKSHLAYLAWRNPVVLFVDNFIFSNVPFVLHCLLFLLVLIIIGISADFLLRKIMQMPSATKTFIISTAFVFLICSCLYLNEQSLMLTRRAGSYAGVLARQTAKKDFDAKNIRIYRMKDGNQKDHSTGQFEGEFEIYYHYYASTLLFDKPCRYINKEWVSEYNNKMKELAAPKKINGK
jgi:hypothetical protein